MIDIIIPAYNAHETIVKTLSNLSLQTIKSKLKVYIVNDCSDKDYKKEIKLFKKYLDIIELKTPKNMGPGLSRQYAMDKSDGKYIFFLDADDQIYNPYILNLFLSKMENLNLDMIYGNEIIEGKSINNDNTGSLHGKMYRRKYLESNGIRFNNTRYSEDDSFNKLCMALSEKIKSEDLITYVYMNNSESITNKMDKKVETLLMYCYNMIWTILELEKRKVDQVKISKLALKMYMYIYTRITNDKYTNYEFIYGRCYRIENIFSKYEKHISKKELEQSIRNNIYTGNLDSKEVLLNFKNFRKKFVIKKSRVDVIIPAYNAHETIMDSIHSIISQSISDKINVYIVNDCSDTDYTKEINEVKDYLNIVEIKTPNRLGIGGARQYGIENSTGEYIIFLDADDVFNDCLSIKNMYNIMEENGENVLGTFYHEETDNGFEEILYNCSKVYGKIYRRKYLIKNKIKFNNTFLYSDFSFNQIISMKEKIKFMNDYTYIHRNNSNSTYKKIKRENGFISFKDLSENIIFTVNESEKRKYNKNNISFMLMEQMYEFYYRFIISDIDEERKDILINIKEVKKLYLKYFDVPQKDYIKNNLNIMHNRLINRLGIEEYSKIDITFNNFLLLIDEFS